MSDFSNTKTGVQAAMSKISLSSELRNFITSNTAVWDTFGKMSSHLYREQLMKSMVGAQLKPDECFMVFFFFSVIKNQPRIIKAMKKMSDADKNQAWYQPVFNFINTRICQYVTEASTSGKFPAVNVPTCNPSLDIYIFTIMAKPEDKTIEKLKLRTTMSQLFLAADAQAKAKEGYTEYWTNIVKGTKNKDNKGENAEKPGMNEDYYNTGASDTYLLLDDNMKEIPAPSGGYTMKNIENYLANRKI